MKRRSEETRYLPESLHALVDACGWQRYARSQANTGETWVPRVGEHVSSGDLRVRRGRDDFARLIVEAPTAARKRAAREEEIAATEEAEAAAILARAAERRARAARIHAALDDLSRDIRAMIEQEKTT